MFKHAFASISAALLITTLVLHAGEPPAETAAGWDRDAAVRYLDARMDLWWTNAKTLKTGDGETKCISCHTAIPYALSRPALRRAAGTSVLTAHEQRMLEFVRQRTQDPAVNQPYYDQNEDKKAESRGVEAVLNALVLTAHDVDVRSDRPGDATTAGIARMWDVQRADGAWDWLNFGLEPYESPDAVFHGATLAALAAGSKPGMSASADSRGRAGLERLRGYLSASFGSQRLFNQVWALLAASRLDGVLTASQRENVLRDLAARQRPDGGWSLADLGTWRWNKHDAPFAPPGMPDSALLAASDGYATGLVVYAMRESGLPATHPGVQKGQQWLREQQTAERTGDPAWAPWRAHSLNHDREHGGPRGEGWRRMFMSDLATAFGALALL